MTNSEKLFLLLAEEDNFSRAAKKAFISQQGLSDHIRRLEEQYGTQLFTRRPSVSLTETGKAVQRTLLTVRSLENSLCDEIGEIENGASGTLRMSMNYARSKIIVPQLFEWLRQHYPRVRLELVPDETVNMVERLRHGEVDFFLGVNTKAEPFMEAELLASESIYLIASEKYLRHYVPGVFETPDKAVELSLFNFLPFATNSSKSTLANALTQYMDASGISVDSVMSSGDFEVLAAVCRSGEAASFCPQLMVPGILRDNADSEPERRLYALPIKGLENSLHFELVRNRALHYPRYAHDFFDMIRLVVREESLFQ